MSTPEPEKRSSTRSPRYPDRPMSPPTQLAYRIGAAAKRPASWLQLFKFGLVGGSGYLVNLVVFTLVTNVFGVHYIGAAIAAFCVAVANNFLWNRHWTFEPGTAHPAHQAARFLTVSLAGLLVNLAVLELLVVETSMSGTPAQAIAVAVAVPFNFIGNKLWTFA